MTYSIQSVLGGSRRASQLYLLPLCLASFAVLAQPNASKPASVAANLQEQRNFWALDPSQEYKPDIAAPEAVAVSELFEEPLKLGPRDFLQTLIRRNLEIKYSQANVAVTARLVDAESGLYEPSLYANIRGDGRRRQRTIEETRQLSSATGQLEENSNTREFGVKGRLPSGAEFSVSQKAGKRSSNLLPQSSLGVFDTEYSGSLALTIKQPLMRNAGRSITETDRRVAQLEHKAAGHQLIQQTLKSALDGLNLYWQLYKAQETAQLRKDAMTAAQSLLNDTQWRISAGRAPSSASLELRSLVLNREMELARSQQALKEAQAKVLSALHAARGSDASIAATPRILTVDAKLDQTPPALGTALESWPPYQLALVRQEQSQVRLSFAKNQRLPNLDLIAGYNGTGLGYRGIDEIGPIAQQFSYPDWYIAVNFEIPLGGGRKTKQQMAAQEERSRQSNIDLEAIRSALANDLPVRLEDLHNARTVLRLSQSEISVRKDIVTNEQQRIQLGSGSISNLIQKQIDWIDARQRGIENQLRYEIAYASWLYSKGFLLRDYGIDIEIE